MQVGEAMSKGARLVPRKTRFKKRPLFMRDHDCGALPVRKDDRLVGVITDRDTVRVVAEGKTSEEIPPLAK